MRYIISPVLMGNWGTERPQTLPKVTQLEGWEYDQTVCVLSADTGSRQGHQCSQTVIIHPRRLRLEIG
jgi:hypothetical protein